MHFIAGERVKFSLCFIAFLFKYTHEHKYFPILNIIVYADFMPACFGLSVTRHYIASPSDVWPTNCHLNPILTLLVLAASHAIFMAYIICIWSC